MKSNDGFSILEVVIASALFVIFSVGIGTVVTQGFSGNRLSDEQTIATEYASEGLEASRSIGRQSFANLVNTSAVGVSTSSGVFAFSGIDNKYGVGDKFTRVIKVEDVRRDGSGNIVSSGGTIDDQSKKITSTVSWNASPTRNNSVVLSTYLTNFRKIIYQSGAKGILVYGDGGSTTDAIKYKIFDNDLSTWSTATSAADIDAGTTNRVLRVVGLVPAQNNSTKMMISRHYDGTTQYIYAQIFDGSTWGNVQLLASFASTANLDVKNFDGVYLANGNFMVVYSDNTTTPKYRTWNGTTWSAQGSLTVISGIPNWIVAKVRPGTNEVMVVILNQASDSLSQYWSGSAWSVVTSHATNATSIATRVIDFEWSPNSPTKGLISYTQSATDKAVRSKIWTANGTGGGAWSAAANTANQANNIGAIDIVARPNADEFQVCDKDALNPPRIICYRLSTVPAVTNPTNPTIVSGSDAGIQFSFGLGFEQSSGAIALNVYSDRTSTPKLKKYTASTNTWDLTATNVPVLGSALKSVSIEPRPASDDMMVLLGGTNLELYSIIWDGTNNQLFTTPTAKSLVSHGTSGVANTAFWYDFAWDE